MQILQVNCVPATVLGSQNHFQIKHRNVRCVTGTCFLIAAKLEETSQVLGHA